MKGGNSYAGRIAITAFCFLAIFTGCGRHKERTVIPAFYYWKTQYKAVPAETEALSSNQVRFIYLRFFDVVKNERGIQPAGAFSAKDSLPSGIQIIPVVFIQNDVLQGMSATEIISLSSRIGSLMQNIALNNHLHLAQEIQLDCDWSGNTREAYFNLINRIKSQPIAAGRQISATIRLHQVKYRGQTGIPPVDRGMLMAYNMGNIRQPGKHNSILNSRDLKAYTGSLSTYPLKLDLALPLFNWFVWFRNDEYKGLVRTSELPGLPHSYQVVKNDTMMAGLKFLKNDVLRYESVNAGLLQTASGILQNKLNTDTMRVALYHLDAALLENWSHEQIKNVYNSLR